MTLYFSEIIYNNSLNKCIFGLNLLVLHKVFLGSNWWAQERVWELEGVSWSVQHRAVGPRSPQLRGAPLRPLPAPQAERPRGPRGGHSWDTAPGSGQQQRGPGWWQQRETAGQGRKDRYFLPTSLERGKFVTGLDTGAQRDSADSRERSSDRFLGRTGALKPLFSFQEVTFVTLPSSCKKYMGLQWTESGVHWHKGGAGKSCQNKKFVLL